MSEEEPKSNKEGITLDNIRRIAEFGLVDDTEYFLHQLGGRQNFRLIEATQVRIIAHKNRGLKLQREAQVYKGLADLSDDPLWQSRLNGEAEKLQNAATQNFLRQESLEKDVINPNR